jgi:3-oxoacyl-[acyl-carrier protein] reductase
VSSAANGHGDPREAGCALVTGGSRGIGAAVTRMLAAEGWRVGIVYRSRAEEAQRLVSEIELAGGSAHAIGADVADPHAAEIVFAGLEERFGPVLTLVNNAGVTSDGLAPRIEDESWQAVIETNLSGAFRMTRRALGPMMRARWGRIVNVGSIVGRRANPGQANYAASKAGLEAMTRTVAAEVARRGITVNAIAPGLISTELTAAGVGNGLVDSIPARRAGTPEEVAACVRFLASDEASYVNGSTLTVDGGLTA